MLLFMKCGKLNFTNIKLTRMFKNALFCSFNGETFKHNLLPHNVIFVNAMNGTNL